MNAIRLKTEYLKNPIAIDIVKPRLFWNCAGGNTAGSVVESASMQTVYAGVPLTSRRPPNVRGAAGTVAIVYSFCCFMVFIIETFMPR